ncbi:MAG: tRNA (adenosine(37)-N6)-threonylcarbamoyltransferase complex ATPase subunit type 1 TsaE [Saprospiraceae bacterium]
MLRLNLPNEEATRSAATLLAKQLRAGDVVILNGGLAAGKTFWVQAMATALGVTNYVSSPTYTIAHFYRYPAGRLLHIDAYRLDTMEEFRDLALDEFWDEVIACIEWGDKVKQDFDDYLVINLSKDAHSETSRQVEITAAGPRSAEIIEQSGLLAIGGKPWK